MVMFGKRFHMVSQSGSVDLISLFVKAASGRRSLGKGVS